jgi:hypothetical protein
LFALVCFARTTNKHKRALKCIKTILQLAVESWVRERETTTATAQAESVDKNVLLQQLG